MTFDPSDPTSPEPQLPERLRGDLRAAFGAGPVIPDGFDDRVRAAAARGRSTRMLIRFRRWIPASAAALAACLLLSVWAVAPRFRAPPALERQSAKLSPAEDLNGDGRVDILDAFRLAHRIDRHESLEPRWDFTGDGHIDRRDVDRVAAAAVRLIREDL